jgi:Tol biopolymer transport system component
MSSIQDDELLIWMMDNKNKITVLTEHFSEFDVTFLSPLSEKYVVFFFDRSGKRVSYDYNLAKTMTGI